jgi:phenylalanyl-tRNA synthetase beta chain
VLTAAGFDEALTTSVVPERWSDAFSPWTSEPPLVTGTPMLEGADRLRRSLVPSLLDARRSNESLNNPVIELFETARVYLPTAGQLPHEQLTLAAVSGRGFLALKGVAEALLAALHIQDELMLENFAHPLAVAGQCVELKLGAERLGFLADISSAGQKAFGLRGPAAFLEISVPVLAAQAVLIPQSGDQSTYPTIARDINLVVAEQVRWAELGATIREAAGPDLERLEYVQTYRDPAKDGPDTKRILFSLTFRAKDRTLTGGEADSLRDAVVAECARRHGARLL